MKWNGRLTRLTRSPKLSCGGSFYIWQDSTHTVGTLKAANTAKIQAITQKGMRTCYQELCTSRSRMSATKRWISGALTLGPLLTFFFRLEEEQ